MSQEWYLMKTDNDTVSGFEGEDFEYFAQDAFEEALESPIGTNVKILNYDLSKSVPRRVIIDGNVQDTKLNTLGRKMLAPIGTCEAGMYVLYDNKYWLITGLVDNNGIYEKAILALCNYKLTWLNDDKEIVQRWVNIVSASQYNNGETTTTHYVIRSDQLLVIMPPDDESVLLSTGKRFIIDNRCKIYEKHFDENVKVDTTKPVNVYKITRNDSVLFDYQNSGNHEFMCSQVEQDKKDGYYVINGVGYWLCDLPNTNKKDADVFISQIEYDKAVVILGGGIETKFGAKFINYTGEDTEAIPIWNVDCDFIDKLNIRYDDKSIYISANDKTRKILNKTFTLSLSAENYQTTNLVITIKPF